MRARDTAFSLVVVVVLLGALALVVQQNPQSSQWTLLGQAFSVSAGVAVAGAALAGFLLAVLFVLPFVGASGAAATNAAETSAQYERDFMNSREQYRQLQAENSRLQSAYNELAAERDRLQAQQTSPATPAATQSQPMPMALSNPNGPERERVHVWGVPDQPGAAQPASDAVTGTTAPSQSGDPNTRIAMPSLAPDATAGSGSARPAPTDTRADLPPSRQVIRPDGSILGSDEENPPPPPDDSREQQARH